MKQWLHRTGKLIMALVCAGSAPLLASAGQWSGEDYTLTFEDTWGAPTITTAGDITRFEFQPFNLWLPDSQPGNSVPEQLNLSLSAAAGFAFFPNDQQRVAVKAWIEVSDLYISQAPEGLTGGVVGDALTTAAPPAPYAGPWGHNRVTNVLDYRSGASTASDFLPQAGPVDKVNVQFTASWYGAPIYGERCWCECCSCENPIVWCEQTIVDYVFADGRFAPCVEVDNRFIAGIPEPATGALLIGGLALLAVAARRTARIPCG